MSKEPTIGERLRAVVDRQEKRGLRLAKALGYQTRSGPKAHFDREDPLPVEVAQRFIDGIAGTGTPPIQPAEIWELSVLPELANPDPDIWIPKPETLLKLWAAAMNVSKEDRAKIGELRDFASAVHTGLRLASRDPSIEDNPEKLDVVALQVAQAVEDARSASSKAA